MTPLTAQDDMSVISTVEEDNERVIKHRWSKGSGQLQATLNGTCRILSSALTSSHFLVCWDKASMMSIFSPLYLTIREVPTHNTSMLWEYTGYITSMQKTEKTLEDMICTTVVMLQSGPYAVLAIIVAAMCSCIFGDVLVTLRCRHHLYVTQYYS